MSSPEQELVQAKDNLGKHSTSRAWSSHHVLHSKVCEITDERSSGPRVCKRVSPEHPLESRHRCDHQTLEQERQCRLAASQTAIKETDAGNDQPDNEPTEHNVSIVVLESGILGVDIDEEGVSALRLG